MGAGKTTMSELAPRIGLSECDVDAVVEHEVGDDIPSYFREHGEAAFRAVEEQWTVRHLETGERAVLALGGGAVTSAAVRRSLRAHAVTIHVDVDVDTAWERVGEPTVRSRRTKRRFGGSTRSAARRTRRSRTRP